MLGGTENQEQVLEVAERVMQINQDNPFYGLPVEIQLYILEQLINDPKFLTHLLSFSLVAKWPNALVKDVSLWKKVAANWFMPGNVEKLSPETIFKVLEIFDKTKDVKLKGIHKIPAKEKYHFFGNALVGITSAKNLYTLERALTKLEAFDYPHYVGTALKIASEAGDMPMTTLLLKELLTKKEHGRASLIHSACRAALEQKNWPIVALLAQTEDCRKNTELMREISTQAAVNNQAELVEQVLEHDLEKLSLTDKLAMLGTPGFMATKLSLNDLFANNHWLIRTPLCFGLRQLGYQATPKAINEDATVDVDGLTDLLADFTLEDETPTFIVSNIANAQAQTKEQADALVVEEPKARSNLAYSS